MSISAIVSDISHYSLPCDEVLGNVDDFIAGLGGFESAVIHLAKKLRKAIAWRIRARVSLFGLVKCILIDPPSKKH